MLSVWLNLSLTFSARSSRPMSEVTQGERKEAEASGKPMQTYSPAEDVGRAVGGVSCLCWSGHCVHRGRHVCCQNPSEAAAELRAALSIVLVAAACASIALVFAVLSCDWAPATLVGAPSSSAVPPERVPEAGGPPKPNAAAADVSAAMSISAAVAEATGVCLGRVVGHEGGGAAMWTDGQPPEGAGAGASLEVGSVRVVGQEGGPGGGGTGSSASIGSSGPQLELTVTGRALALEFAAAAVTLVVAAVAGVRLVRKRFS
uniref:Uncharacterized protein n=1 Tax=Haptolina brevifila TaxID=156173 RepID=A0A7S2C8C2_9EUKA|mmetsp:Transcript_21537/g.43637  ORF Transcript_21537/g.43637 Transcript_21537/m.43637 type:complete len:260 (+) Transcript_21537:79-858(+)